MVAADEWPWEDGDDEEETTGDEKLVDFDVDQIETFRAVMERLWVDTDVKVSPDARETLRPIDEMMLAEAEVDPNARQAKFGHGLGETDVAMGMDSPVMGGETAGTPEHTLDNAEPMVPPAPMPSATIDVARAAWLAKQDSPSWGASYEAAGEVPTTRATEVAAKAAWLAKLDAPVWGGTAAAPASAACAAPAADAAAAFEAAATMSEAAAKTAWLAKLDAPVWGGTAAAAASAACAAPAAEAAAAFEAAATMSEAAAKAAWLAKLDAPVWGAGGAIATAPVAAYDAPVAVMPSEADVPMWGQGLTQASRVGMAVDDDEAKAAWLAKLDAPATWESDWGVVRTSQPGQPADEQARAAKSAWFAKQGIGAPKGNA